MPQVLEETVVVRLAHMNECNSEPPSKLRMCLKNGKKPSKW